MIWLIDKGEGLGITIRVGYRANRGSWEEELDISETDTNRLLKKLEKRAQSNREPRPPRRIRVRTRP